MPLCKISKSHMIGAVAAFAITLSLGGAKAQAQVIIQHSGNTDPITEGFVDAYTSYGSQSGAAWNVTGPDCCDYYGYNLTAANVIALDGASEWNMVATMRNLAAPYYEGAYAVILLNGTRFDLGLRSDGLGNQILNLSYGQGYPGSPNYTIAGLGTDPVTLSLIYSNSTNSAGVFVNGTEVISGYAGVSQGGNAILFGGADGDFTNVELLAGASSSVPEPSTWAMMLLGLAGLGFAACRRTSGRLAVR